MALNETIISPLAAQSQWFIPAPAGTPTTGTQQEAVYVPGANGALSLGRLSLPGIGTYTNQSLLPTSINTNAYSYPLPMSEVQVGNQFMYGDKLNENSPYIQSLTNSGMATPIKNGVIVTRAPQSPYQQARGDVAMAGATTGMTGQQYSQQQGGGAIPTLTGQPSVPYNYEVKPLTKEQQQSEEAKLRHELSLTVGNERIPKDLTPYINAKVFGGYTTQDVANHLTELARKGTSQIVNPTVQRWHWIVGGQYNQPTGAPTGTAGATGGGLANPPVNGYPTGFDRGGGLFEALAGMQFDQPTEVPLPGDYTDEQKYAQEAYAKQQEMNTANTNATIAGIQAEFDNAMRATATKFDQDIAKQTASLARMGALGTTTAASSYLQGLEQQKQAAINDLTQKKAAAEAAAVQAQQTGDWNAYNEMRKAYFDARKDYEKESTSRWNTRLESEQKSVNRFTAMGNQMLGVLGKALEAQGLDIKQQDVDNATEKLRNDIDLQERKFQFDVQKYGMDFAAKQLNAAGFAQLQDGTIVPTVEYMRATLKNAAGGGGINVGGENFQPEVYVGRDEQGNLKPNEDAINEAAKEKNVDYNALRTAVYNYIAKQEAASQAQTQTLTEQQQKSTGTDYGIIGQIPSLITGTGDVLRGAGETIYGNLPQAAGTAYGNYLRNLQTKQTQQAKDFWSWLQ